MNSKKKYELRSKEVQELLNTPPRLIIFWGNTIILMLLFCGLFYLGKNSITQKISLPFQVNKTEGNPGVEVDLVSSKLVQTGQKIILRFTNRDLVVEDVITKLSDSSGGSNPVRVLLLKDFSTKNLYTDKINSLSCGQAEIQVAKSSLLDLLASNLYRTRF